MTAPDPARDRAARAAHKAFAEHIVGNLPEERIFQIQVDTWRAVVDAVAAELAKPDFVYPRITIPTSPNPAEAMAGELTDLATRIVARAREAGGLGRGLDDSYMRGVGMIEAAEIVRTRARELVEGEAGR